VKRGPDRLNSTVLTLLALVLIAVGGYGLARGYGAFGDTRAAAPILTDDVADLVARNAGWFWPAAAVLALLLSWLGLRWLVAQITSPAIQHLPVPADGPGRTELLASGATAALARDIEEYAGVRSARARMVGDHPVAEVGLTVDVHDDADVGGLRRRIEEHALARFAGALELAELRSVVHIRLAERAGRTVR
jgi:hypothetical protein